VFKIEPTIIVVELESGLFMAIERCCFEIEPEDELGFFTIDGEIFVGARAPRRVFLLLKSL
jgi:hypothetical protein